MTTGSPAGLCRIPQSSLVEKGAKKAQNAPQGPIHSPGGVIVLQGVRSRAELTPEPTSSSSIPSCAMPQLRHGDQGAGCIWGKEQAARHLHPTPFPPSRPQVSPSPFVPLLGFSHSPGRARRLAGAAPCPAFRKWKRGSMRGERATNTNTRGWGIIYNAGPAPNRCFALF